MYKLQNVKASISTTKCRSKSLEVISPIFYLLALVFSWQYTPSFCSFWLSTRLLFVVFFLYDDALSSEYIAAVQKEQSTLALTCLPFFCCVCLMTHLFFRPMHIHKHQFRLFKLAMQTQSLLVVQIWP